MTSPRDDDPHSERLPRPGDRIAGKYVVERVLKRGGMGVILAARHAELAQPVAIKVLLPALATDASMVARFLREGRAVSALRSDHVVRVHDVGRLEGGTPYLVMEMLHGSDLDRRVRKGGPLPWQEAVGYVMQACEALVEAHALGIIHRDLKPSNLFLVELPSGVATVKVLDFGISKADGLDVPLTQGEAITTTEAVLGSPTFMAPEQLKSAKYVDARADIWSLGLVLYFLLTGKLAFDAETLGAYLLKILQDPPIPVRAFRPDVPPELEAILLRCIEKDPAMRFPTVADLRAALAPFAPFAAHVSGVYSAAPISGSWSAVARPPSSPGLSAAPSPVAGGLGPAMPAPIGGAFGPATPGHLGAVPGMPTPAGGALPPIPTSIGGNLTPGMPTPAGGVPRAPLPTPVAPYPVGSLLGPPPSDPPSAPFGSISTQASWTSGKLRRPSGLRWAIVIGAVAVGIALTALLWPADATPPAGTPAAGASASDVPSALPATAASTPSAAASEVASSASSTASSAAASASDAPNPADAPTNSPSASVTVSAAAPPSTTPSPAFPATGRPRVPPAPTKRISGPMETDL